MTIKVKAMMGCVGKQEPRELRYCNMYCKIRAQDEKFKKISKFPSGEASSFHHLKTCVAGTGLKNLLFQPKDFAGY